MDNRGGQKEGSPDNIGGIPEPDSNHRNKTRTQANVDVTRWRAGGQSKGRTMFQITGSICRIIDICSIWLEVKENISQDGPERGLGFDGAARSRSTNLKRRVAVVERYRLQQECAPSARVNGPNEFLRWSIILPTTTRIDNRLNDIGGLKLVGHQSLTNGSEKQSQIREEEDNL
ncbi:hypothetical protein B0H13DRAFT_1863805 [Mycena leptocephala]|nr:hypothetical protein B0H13DRAFT_1863805 [Mycena leptocephala]